jgi:CelD/BcsL family acetyltransferase involved in cellulose biosynthesis
VLATENGEYFIIHGEALRRMSLHGELLGGDVVDALADDWRALAVAQGNAFLTPEWFGAWRRHYSRGSSPAVVVVRDSDGGVVGLLPLARVGRTTQFAGANLGDWFSPLTQPGRELEVAAAAAAVLAEAGHRTLVLHNVDEDAEWITEMMRAWPGSLVKRELHRDVIPYLSLPPSWNEFLEQRSRNFRSQIGRKERKLQRSHGMEFQLVDDPVRLQAAMESFFALHNARWSGDIRRSSLAGAKAQAHHRDFAAMALERGWLRLWFLMAAGRPVAALYGWRIGHRYCFFNAGWDPAWTQASVGLVLLSHTIRSAIEEGAQEYSFLLGDEAYKSRFSTGQCTVQTVAIAPRSSPSRVAIYFDASCRRAARALPAGVRIRLGSTLAPIVAHLPGTRSR